MAKGIEQGLEQGRQLGLEAGKMEGLAEGRAEGHRELLLELLSARFGELPAKVTTRVKNMADAELLMVARELWSVESLDALAKILNNGDK